jgi:hypothetical protein
MNELCLPGVQLVSRHEMFKIRQFPFKDSAGWIQNFKKKHKIRQRHVTKYISSKENTTFEEVKVPKC